MLRVIIIKFKSRQDSVSHLRNWTEISIFNCILLQFISRKRGLIVSNLPSSTPNIAVNRVVFACQKQALHAEPHRGSCMICVLWRVRRWPCRQVLFLNVATMASARYVICEWEFVGETAPCVQNTVFLNELCKGTCICESVIQSAHTTRPVKKFFKICSKCNEPFRLKYQRGIFKKS
jgi:hypothetical protein